MKAMWFTGSARGLSLACGLLLAAASGSLAQTSDGSEVPVVTVQATQPIATVSNSGAFTVFRAGNTNLALNVWYDLGGTASNGVDYAAIPLHLVEIPAGATSNTITIVITPPTNPPPLSVLKTVVLTLTNSPLMNPVNYEIGSPSQATVLIPARIGIIFPQEGMIFYNPTKIPILASVSDNSLTNLEFFAGTNDLGNEMLNPGGRGLSNGFVWTNPPAGNYALTVVASYDDLAWTWTIPPVGYYAVTSAPVNITVLAGPPLTNLPPVVGIVSPANGATYIQPANIPLLAGATNSDGTVTNVEFFAGTNDLGRGLALVLDPPFGSLVGGGVVYYFDWQNPPPGNYPLTAVAADNAGLSTTSAPVNIVVQLPPTNLPPVVSIVSPASGAMFSAPADISLLAHATDPDGSVTNVEFFANGADLGRGLPVVLDPPGVNGVTGLVCFFNWQNVPTNNYSLTAVATDNGGLSTTSAPVKILVQLPSTNLPPVVRITSPADGAMFFAPINIPLYVYAFADESGNSVIFNEVTNLEFYADGADLGTASHVEFGPPPPAPGEPTPLWIAVLPDNFFLLWSNAPVGKHSLIAVAEDQFGNAATSAPVNISVAPAPPPPTNRPPLVGIVATDPVAIEGTNCWSCLGLTNGASDWSNWIVAASAAALRPITNCGPKNATFAVFRAGDTNDGLIVNYFIGGSATNGVDYAALPGEVQIPAGQRQASISIVPVDDGPPDLNSTVILKLMPGTNYLVGFPASAAAIILDNQSPRAASGVMPGNVFVLNTAGPDGAWFQVDYTTDMIHWTPVCTNQVVNGEIDFADPDMANQPARFYRVLPEDSAPQ